MDTKNKKMNDAITEKLKRTLKKLKITKGYDLVLKPSSDANLMIKWSRNPQSRLRSDSRKPK